MINPDALAAIEAIRQVKAKYWRGVDTRDDDLVRSILSADCELDYMGCCTDPVTGVDHMPAMNMVLRGRDNWSTGSLDGPAPVTVHQGHQSEIDVVSDSEATGIWYFTDRFYMPAGSPFARLTGHGRYHDRYVVEDGAWKLSATRIERYHVETT